MHTGNGPKFIQMRETFNRERITLTTLSPSTLNSNRLAERINRVLVYKARAVIDYCGLKSSYCCEAVRHAADLQNITVAAELGKRTPMEAP